MLRDLGDYLIGKLGEALGATLFVPLLLPAFLQFFFRRSLAMSLWSGVLAALPLPIFTVLMGKAFGDPADQVVMLIFAALWGLAAGAIGFAMGVLFVHPTIPVLRTAIVQRSLDVPNNKQPLTETQLNEACSKIVATLGDQLGPNPLEAARSAIKERPSTLIALAKTPEQRTAVRDALDELGVLDPSDGLTLFSFASAPRPRLGDPALERNPKERAAYERAAKEYISAAEQRQMVYLAGSGTLTQFNAIMAAILAAALTALTPGSLRIVVAAALALHVLAAFLLCWACRPVAEKSNAPLAFAHVDVYRHTDDTFRQYRRGWRMTMVALIASSAAIGFYLLQTFEPGLIF